MWRFGNRNRKPLVKQLEFDFGRNYDKLYELDRNWVIEKEKLKGRELDRYDRNIELEKQKQYQKKVWILIEAKEQLEASTIKNKSFKLSFNEYNGYRIEYNGKVYETYNFLFDEYVKKIFREKLL